ncbi:MAG: hypothetical protein KA327_10035 [Pseudarcicella sp.]|nr:hypothetical protein [Pseudarcicella sp.]
MKKLIIVTLFIAFLVVAYGYNKYYGRSLVLGNPVLNHNIEESKANKTFICRYRNIEKESEIFKEIWLEKNSTRIENGIKLNGFNSLKLSFVKKKELNFEFIETNLKQIKANFKIYSFGLHSMILSIGIDKEEILKLDSLKISYIHNNQHIEKIFLKDKSKLVVGLAKRSYDLPL